MTIMRFEYGSKSLIPSSFYLIGLFYYTIGNIDPKFRSGLHNIQLLAVVRTALITKYGIAKILEPFIAALKSLESVSSTMMRPIDIIGANLVYRTRVYLS